MRRDLLFSGAIGLLIGAAKYAGASALSARIPILLQGTIVSAIAFVILLLLALIEIPLMMFGLRQMARRASTPRWLVAAAFGIYVAFAAFYAAMFVLLTGQIVWGLVIAAGCLARFVSGLWIK